MTATPSAEPRERSPGRPSPHQGSVERRKAWYPAVIAALIFAALGFGAGWLVFGQDDAAVDGAAAFPTGRFVNEQFETRFFEFDADGTYFYSESTGPSGEVGGTYGIRGDLYAEMTHDYPGIQKVPATYRWAFDGERLTFELVGEDVISHRAGVYGDAVYVRGD